MSLTWLKDEKEHIKNFMMLQQSIWSSSATWLHSTALHRLQLKDEDSLSTLLPNIFD